MNLFQQRKNKRFSYLPRHLRDSNVNSKDNIKAHWKSVRKHGGKSSNRLLMLLIILGMIIAIWFVLTNYEIS